MKNTLMQLLREITSQPALENDFYRRWMSGSFSIEELEIFARNYEAWVKSFPDALATLVGATNDLDAKGEYVKTLYSEMGYGNAIRPIRCYSSNSSRSLPQTRRKREARP